MKLRFYLIIAACLIVGAVLYSGGPVLAQFGPNPLLAGARAARPNGVPSCLFPCEHEPAGDNEVNDNEAAEHEGAVTTIHAAAPAHASTRRAQAVAVASAKAKNNAHAKAVAIATSVTVHKIVVLPARRVVVQKQRVVVHTRVVVVQGSQVVVSQPQPAPPAQMAAVQTAAAAPQAPLPATGPVAFSGALGTTAILGAAYYLLRSRRALLRAVRRT
jgi:hypothetical protein